MATINHLAQSPDGYLWIGTDGSELVRYDGKNFLEIRDPNGDNNHHFTSIFPYGDSVLFGSRYKGFYTYHTSKRKMEEFFPRFSFSGEARVVLRNSTEHYFISNRAIYYSKKGASPKKISSTYNELVISQYFAVSNGFVILSNQGAMFLSDGTIVPLDKWLNLSLSNPSEFQFGYLEESKLILYNHTVDRFLEVVLTNNSSSHHANEFNMPNKLADSEYIVAASHSSHSKVSGLLSNHGHLYSMRNSEIEFIAHNYDQKLEEPKGILADLNGDFWINSSLRGIYKVSIEGFTKLQLLPIYQQPDIMFPYRTIYGDVIISTLKGKTSLRNLVDDSVNQEFDFTLHAGTEYNGVYYFASNKGIKLYHPEHSPDFPTAFFHNQKINLVHAEGHDLWVGVSGSGLHKIDLKTNEIKIFREQFKDLPEYFYTVQSCQGGELIFGTNDGIYAYKKKTGTIARLELPYEKTGVYSGVSTKDVYGTCWFSLEKGILGISGNNTYHYIEGEKNFLTNIVYTLNSDNYGNLIIGTNKGVSILKVTRNGDIKDKRHYDGKSGFDGYETNMRSQFQHEDGIFVGTVEGLFLINTKILENLKSPLPPVIEEVLNGKLDQDSRNRIFHFQVNNPKAGKISYSYRVIGYQDEWVNTDDHTIEFNDLFGGDYVLEVRSSFDGVNQSEISRFPFKVIVPIWQNRWFIAFMIILTVFLNIVLLRYNKAFEMNKLLDTKDSMVHLRMTPEILLFGAVTVSVAHIFSPLINPELKLHLGGALSIGFTLFVLYFLSLHSRKVQAEKHFQTYLIVAVILIISHFFVELYLSGLHPFHTLGIVICCMILPYVFNKVRSTIIFGVLILALGIIISVFTQNPVYPKSYLLVALFAAVGLLIFTSYIRYDSLEKLMFISGIINRGNVPAVAFDRHGMISYVSENITRFIPMNDRELLGKKISTLNQFVPFDDSYRNVDMLSDFVDGEKYLVPMLHDGKTLRWVEWSYIDFSKNVKVILGQDVTDKKELENTYELLVQHAEDIIFRCDIKGNFLFVNNATNQKLGYDRNELIGKSVLDIVLPEFREEMQRYYQENFNNKQISSYREYPIQTKSGELIWIGQQITAILEPGSDYYINGFIALGRDITKERKQQQLIRDQRDNITDSINYAKRIQFNLLPHERQFSACFKEHYILFKPKDIVSGDFYWCESVDGKIILALADCTGHGVPGSFMTLLGINLLNTIVLEEKITDPGKILNELDKRLMVILPRDNGENSISDGMEISICVLDNKNDELSYACAGSRFLIYSNNEFTMYKSDAKHIGDMGEYGFKSYQTYFTHLGTDDQLYLLTDGFQDQFGGPNDKKFSFRRLLEIFESSSNLPLFEQKQLLEEEYESWIGNGEQTDDLTVISIRRNRL